MLKKIIALLLAMLIIPFSHAQEPVSKQTELLLDELKQTINSTLSEINRIESQRGNNLAQLDLTLEQGELSSGSFGIVLESETNVVLSVSPFSIAAKLGLLSGDKLEKFFHNERLINIHHEAISFKKNDQIKAYVLRGSKALVLTDTVDLATVPSWKLEVFTDSEERLIRSIMSEIKRTPSGACGKLSTFFKPPESKRIYAVEIKSVNGEGILTNTDIVTLPPGDYIVYLNEQIPDNEISRRTYASRKAKKLEVTIEADKTYHLGAQFNSLQKFETMRLKHWDPVIWKVTDSKCEQ